MYAPAKASHASIPVRYGSTTNFSKIHQGKTGSFSLMNSAEICSRTISSYTIFQ